MKKGDWRSINPPVLLISVVLLAVGAGVGCDATAKALGKPLPEIVGASARETIGLDYQVHVDCTVKNSGADGDVTVYAELRKGGYWKKEREVFIPADGSQKVTLSFSEPTLVRGGLASGDYSCGAEG